MESERHDFNRHISKHRCSEKIITSKRLDGIIVKLIDLRQSGVLADSARIPLLEPEFKYKGYRRAEFKDEIFIIQPKSSNEVDDAVDCALQRASGVLGISVEEVKNRCTVNGGLEIGRAPAAVPT